MLEIRGKRETLFTIGFYQSSYSGTTNIPLIKLWDGKRKYYATTLEDIFKIAEKSVSEPGVIDGELPELTEKKEGRDNG